MVDIVDAPTRSRMMSNIRSKNTRPELLFRRSLHARGFRFRLHDKKLPGTPDIVLSRHRAVIFIHGCFWHGHNCSLFKWPGTRVEFWQQKIGRNQTGDVRHYSELASAGWRIAVVWECAIRGRHRRPAEDVTRDLADWLISGGTHLELREKPNAQETKGTVA